MLTANGCRQRRMRLWERLGTLGVERLALADPIHLRYFANADFDPISLVADMPAVLLITRDGNSTLVLDRRSPHSVDAAHVDEDFQWEKWGVDALAKARRERQWGEMQAASRLLDLARPGGAISDG